MGRSDNRYTALNPCRYQPSVRLPPTHPTYCVHQRASGLSYKMATKVQKIMTQPINLIFRFLQSKQRIQIWLYDQVRLAARTAGTAAHACIIHLRSQQAAIPVAMQLAARMPFLLTFMHAHACRVTCEWKGASLALTST